MIFTQRHLRRHTACCWVVWGQGETLPLQEPFPHGLGICSCVELWGRAVYSSPELSQGGGRAWELDLGQGIRSMDCPRVYPWVCPRVCSSVALYNSCEHLVLGTRGRDGRRPRRGPLLHFTRWDRPRLAPGSPPEPVPQHCVTFCKAGRTQSVISQILTLNDVSLGLPLTLNGIFLAQRN